MWREMEDLLSLDDGSLKVRSSGTSWGREVCPLMCGSPEGGGYHRQLKEEAKEHWQEAKDGDI